MGGRSAATPRDGLSVVVDNVGTAEQAGLRYVTDDRPGITRRRAGRGFSYRAPDGSRLTDKKRIEAIRALAIPPAWTDVWICPNPDGHVLATGRDARGRKQYRYHPALARGPRRHQVRPDARVRRGAADRSASAVERDLDLRGLPREKVLAAVLHLIDATLIRVGNDEYARRTSRSALSTMRNEHAEVRGRQGAVRVPRQARQRRRRPLADRRLARIVRRCQDLPGEELFAVPGRARRRARRALGGRERLPARAGRAGLHGQGLPHLGRARVLAAGLLGEIGAGDTEAETTRRQNTAIRVVAHDLGNTPAVCRSSYIHPVVLEEFRAGNLQPTRLEADGPVDGLRETESYVLELLGD